MGCGCSWVITKPWPQTLMYFQAAWRAVVHAWGWGSGSLSWCFWSNKDWELQISFFRRFLAHFLQAQGVHINFRCSHKLWSAALNCSLLLFRCMPCRSQATLQPMHAAAARDPLVSCHPGSEEASQQQHRRTRFGRSEGSQHRYCPRSSLLSRHSSSHVAFTGIIC